MVDYINKKSSALEPFNLAKLRLQGIDPLQGFQNQGVFSGAEMSAMASIAYRHGREHHIYNLRNSDTAWLAIDKLLSNPKIAAMVEDYKSPITPRLLESEELDASGRLPKDIVEDIRQSTANSNDGMFTDPSRFEEDLMSAYKDKYDIKALESIAKQAEHYYKRAAVINLAVNPFDRDLDEGGRDKALGNFKEFYDDYNVPLGDRLINLGQSVGWTDTEWMDNADPNHWENLYFFLDGTNRLGVSPEVSEFSLETLQQVTKNLAARRSEIEESERRAAQRKIDATNKVITQIMDCQNTLASEISHDYQEGWSDEERHRDGDSLQLSRAKLEIWARWKIASFVSDEVKQVNPLINVSPVRDFPRITLPKMGLGEAERYHAFEPKMQRAETIKRFTMSDLDEFPLDRDHPLSIAFAKAVDDEQFLPMNALWEITEALKEGVRNSLNRITLEFDVKAVATTLASKINETLADKVLLNGEPRSLSAKALYRSDGNMQEKGGTLLIGGILDLQRCETLTQFAAAVVAGAEAAGHVDLDAACRNVVADPHHRKSLVKLIQGSGQRIAMEDGKTVVGHAKIPLDTLLTSQISAHQNLHHQNHGDEVYDPLLKEVQQIAVAARLVTLRAASQPDLDKAHAAKSSTGIKRTEEVNAASASGADAETQDVEPGMIPGGPRKSWLGRIFG